MKINERGLSALFILALSALPGFAQEAGRGEVDSGWQIEAAGYLWLPESRSSVATPFGTASSTLSASDALDALDFGAMAAINARRGDWALVGDFFYLDLTLVESSPLGLLYSGAETRTQLTSVSGYGLYTFHESETLRFEAGGGLRFMSSDIDLTLRGNLVADRHSSISDSWVDPIIAFRTTANLSDNLKGVLWLDGGGFNMGNSSDRTWQISAMVDWQITEKWTLGAGYRTLYIDRENDGLPYDLRMSGPILGASVKF